MTIIITIIQHKNIKLYHVSDYSSKGKTKMYTKTFIVINNGYNSYCLLASLFYSDENVIQSDKHRDKD